MMKNYDEWYDLHPEREKPEGMKILKLLVDEVCETFAELPYLHIGSFYFLAYKHSTKCQEDVLSLSRNKI